MSLTDFCRLCGTLLTSKRVKMLQIMPESLRLKIFKIIPYKISIDDKLPKDCCYKCIDTLKNFIAFVDKSWTIQKTFFRRATLEQNKTCHVEETLNLPYPHSWYDNSLGYVPSTSSGEVSSGKKSEEEESTSESKINQETIIEKEAEETENALSEDEQEEQICERDSPTSPLIDKRKVVAEKEVGTKLDDNVARTFSQSQDKKNTNKKKKFKHKNPFCAPKFKKRGTKKRRTEAEKLVADNIEHYGGEPTPSCGLYFQLFVHGELTSVQREPSSFKSSSFIMTSIPGFGIAFMCTKCDVFFTSEAAASVHDCNDAILSSEATGNSSQYGCQICDLSFPRRVALESHLASHLMSDVTDDESDVKVKPRRRRRVSSSDLDMEVKKQRRTGNERHKSKKYTSDSGDSVHLSEADNTSDSDSSRGLDNFIVDDDHVDYEDDFIVEDEEALNRRRLKGKSRKSVKKRRNSSSRRARFLFM